MGRNAGGNRGISLRKGDYVIGAAVTNSFAMRDTERDACAANLGQTDKLTAMRQECADAEKALQEIREKSRSHDVDPVAIKAAEKAVEHSFDAMKRLDEKLGVTRQLILTITENGFGKRTDVDEYRLTSRGAQGVTNLKATPKVGKSTAILLVDETSELMVISQFGKIIRIDPNQVRSAGRATQGVHLLNLDQDDKIAAAVIIPPEELSDKDEDEQGSLLQ